MLQGKIEQIKKDFSNEISNIDNDKQLEELRVKYFSKNGLVASLFILLKDAHKDEKPQLVKVLNIFRSELQSQFNVLNEQISNSNNSKNINIEDLVSYKRR